MAFQNQHFIESKFRATCNCGIAILASDWLVQQGLARIIEHEIGENVISLHSDISSVNVETTLLLIWLPREEDEIPHLAGVVVLGLGDARGTSLISWLPNWRADEVATAATVATLYAECVASKQTHSMPTNLDKTTPYLTTRQTCVLRALALGMSNAEIGNKLHMAENTVRIHISAIFKALKVTNRTQAALQASRIGIAATTDSLQ